MSRANGFFLLVAVCAIAAALWYRQQVFQEAPDLSPPRLAFVTGGSGPYWQLTANGARTAAKEFQCDLTVEMPDEEESLEQQMNILARLTPAELDGIALSPLDADGQSQLINRLQQQTNIVTFDSDAPLSARRGHVGTSNYGAGLLCGKLVREALPEGGTVLVLLANLTKENMVDRKSGLVAALTKPKDAPDDETTDEEKSTGEDETNEEQEATDVEENADAEQEVDVTIVDFMIDNGDPDQIQQNIRQALEQHPDLSCIVGMNAQHGPQIVEVLQAEGKLGKVKAIAFDEEEGTLRGIENGYIFATIAQDPFKYGYETVRMLDSLYRKKDMEVPIVGGGTVNISTEAIRQENVEAFRERLKERAASAENLEE